MNLNVIVVPTHICNLKCRYCYNEDERRPIMTRQTLDAITSSLIAYTKDIEQLAGVTFIWHGGEPTVAGLDFYRDAVALQEKYAQGMRITNLIQTNGLLLSNEWFSFLKKITLDLACLLMVRNIYMTRIGEMQPGADRSTEPWLF